MLYFSYIYPKISYGVELYGSGPKSCVDQLEIMCNCILRILQNQHFLYPTRNLYLNYNTLPVHSLFNFTLSRLTFKYINFPHLIPPAISQLLQLNKEVHSYNTRNKNDFSLNNIITSYKNPLSLATQFWNKFSANMKSSPSQTKFKQLLKSTYNILTNLDSKVIVISLFKKIITNIYISFFGLNFVLKLLVLLHYIYI